MKKILLIDDDETFLKTVNDFLSSEGYNIIVAKDGSKGLEVVEKESPDLILLDLLMPNSGGMDFLKILHEDERLSKIPILILTNLTSMNLVDEGLKFGARGYIVKSNESLKTIKSSIESVIGNT
ncbi:MAG: response regulator [bacterium]|nr:response regulator [bacterium]